MRGVDRARSPSDRFGWWLLVLGLLAYGWATAGQFVYDDYHSVHDNPALKDLSELPRLLWDVDAFSALDNRMYRPVLLVSFSLTHALFGMSSVAFKLGNVLLHCLVAVLLYGVVRRLGISRTAARWSAGCFAVHPVAVEAVNMVSARSELMLGLGVVSALWCYLATRYVRWRDQPVRALGLWCALGLSSVLACGSKETGVVIPGVLAAVAVAQLAHRRWRSPWRSLRIAVVWILPTVLVSFGYLWLRAELFGHATVPMREWSGGGNAFEGHSRDLATQLATMTYLVPLSLLQLIVPAWSSLDPYVPFTDRWSDPSVVAGAVLVLGLIAWAVARPSRRGTFVGTAIACAAAGPWIVIPLNVPLCEHRLYGVLIGMALVLATAVGALIRRASSPAGISRCRVAASLVGAVFVWLSATRSLEYRDERLLWERALALHPNSVRAYCGLGDCAGRRGDREQTLHYSELAVRVYPDHVAARRNVAEMNLQLGAAGDPWRALVAAESLVERWPNNPFYLLLKARSLAAAAADGGGDSMFDEAVVAAMRCLDVAPPKALVYRTAASARRLQGRPDAALELLERALAAGQTHYSVHLDRVELLREVGRTELATALLRRVANQAPFDARVLRLLATERTAAPPR